MSEENAAGYCFAATKEGRDDECIYYMWEYKSSYIGFLFLKIAKCSETTEKTIFQFFTNVEYPSQLRICTTSPPPLSITPISMKDAESNEK